MSRRRRNKWLLKATGAFVDALQLHNAKPLEIQCILTEKIASDGTLEYYYETRLIVKIYCQRHG